jgi:hypothetical protein
MWLEPSVCWVDRCDCKLWLHETCTRALCDRVLVEQGHFECASNDNIFDIDLEYLGSDY